MLGPNPVLSFTTCTTYSYSSNPNFSLYNKSLSNSQSPLLRPPDSHPYHYKAGHPQARSLCRFRQQIPFNIRNQLCKLRAFIDPGKSILWLFLPQELTQRTPSILHLPLQQPSLPYQPPHLVHRRSVHNNCLPPLMAASESSIVKLVAYGPPLRHTVVENA